MAFDALLSGGVHLAIRKRERVEWATVATNQDDPGYVEYTLPTDGWLAFGVSGRKSRPVASYPGVFCAAAPAGVLGVPSAKGRLTRLTATPAQIAYRSACANVTILCHGSCRSKKKRLCRAFLSFM